MDRHLTLRIKPFTVRHKKLVQEGWLPEFPPTTRNRIWSSLSLFNEYFVFDDDTGYQHNTSDLREAEALYTRVLGIDLADTQRLQTSLLEHVVLHESAWSAFDVIECFCAWIDDSRLLGVQRALNDTFRDFEFPWRLADGQIFMVDNAFMEDEVLAEASPLLALAEFDGAKNEFKQARNALVDGNTRDAIVYAAASVESTYKAALGGSSKVGVELVQAYVNANMMEGLVKSKAQAIQKSLMPTAMLGNELGRHGHGADVLEVPIEYAELAVSLAASINAFISKQHLRRKDVVEPKTATPMVESPTPVSFVDDDIPF
ncbi:MAG: hypothetical protein EPN58_11355 [Rhodanobacter sp.]|nr:MAG: hypothetical protein EPN58_11355 [Rhodanobacter sp.]